MKILLDTHVFLWYISADARLSNKLQHIIRDPTNEVFLSPISVWEAIIKHQTGKLELPEPPQTYLPRQRHRHLISSLPLDEASVTHLAVLPPLHRDPFDRMLVCQAHAHDLTLATVDPVVREYTIPTIDGS